MFYKGEIVLAKHIIKNLKIVSFTIQEVNDKISIVKDENGSTLNIRNEDIISIGDTITLFKKELFKQSEILNRIDKFIEDLSVLKEKNIQLTKEKLENKK